MGTYGQVQRGFPCPGGAEHVFIASPKVKSTMSTQKIIVIGGVAGGIAAATRIRRLNDSVAIVVLERGPYISFANCGLPYHISGEVPDREILIMSTPQSLRERYGIDVRVNCDAIAIDRANKSVTVRCLISGREYEEGYDALILSPGAAPVRPSLPGMDDRRIFTLRTMVDLDRIMEALSRGVRRVAIVGAGYIGLEVVEACRKTRAGMHHGGALTQHALGH